MRDVPKFKQSLTNTQQLLLQFLVAGRQTSDNILAIAIKTTEDGISAFAPLGEVQSTDLGKGLGDVRGFQGSTDQDYLDDYEEFESSAYEDDEDHDVDYDDDYSLDDGERELDSDSIGDDDYFDDDDNDDDDRIDEDDDRIEDDDHVTLEEVLVNDHAADLEDDFEVEDEEKEMEVVHGDMTNGRRGQKEEEEEGGGLGGGGGRHEEADGVYEQEEESKEGKEGKEGKEEEKRVGRPSSSSFSVARELVGSILTEAKIGGFVDLGRNLVDSAVESAIKEINLVKGTKRDLPREGKEEKEGTIRKEVHRRFGRKVRCVPQGSVFAMITIMKIGSELHVTANVPSAHHSAVKNKIILSAKQFAKDDKATNMVLEHLMLKKLEDDDSAYKFVESVFGRRFSGARGVRFSA